MPWSGHFLGDFLYFLGVPLVTTCRFSGLGLENSNILGSRRTHGELQKFVKNVKELCACLFLLIITWACLCANSSAPRLDHAVSQNRAPPWVRNNSLSLFTRHFCFRFCKQKLSMCVTAKTTALIITSFCLDIPYTKWVKKA